MREKSEATTRLGENLRRERRAAGLSQKALEKQAGLSQRLPCFETLIKVAGALEVPVVALTDEIIWEPIVAIQGGVYITPDEDGG